MPTIKKWNVVKIAVLVLATSLALIGPSPALAWNFHGRMTGGGSVFNSDGTEVITGVFDDTGRVTHGFELHCAPRDLPNNLQINWGGNRFHLETLDDVTCFDDPAIEPTPPGAGFDTYVGMGTGRYNGASGYCAEWTFTDAGEPGTKDAATILITDCGGTVVLSVSGKLTFGNHQAHKNP